MLLVGPVELRAWGPPACVRAPRDSPHRVDERLRAFSLVPSLTFGVNVRALAAEPATRKTLQLSRAIRSFQSRRQCYRAVHRAGRTAHRQLRLPEWTLQSRRWTKSRGNRPVFLPDDPPTNGRSTPGSDRRYPSF